MSGLQEILAVHPVCAVLPLHRLMLTYMQPSSLRRANGSAISKAFDTLPDVYLPTGGEGDRGHYKSDGRQGHGKAL
jgi:hypothetical protein